MFTLLLSAILAIGMFLYPDADSRHVAQNAELEAIAAELDLALDNFWALLDDQELDLFVAGVRHAARARLLLELRLGDNIDNVGLSAATIDPQELRLRLIARRASDLSAAYGRELWRQDYDDLNRPGFVGDSNY